MSYYAIVTTLKDVRKHPNADRLQLAEVFGNTVCVSLDYAEGQLGVYFPTGGQLSVKFAEANNLLRKKDAEGNNIGGYMDPDKRNVTAIKLRGEKSDGLFLPLSCLDTFGDSSTLRIGDRIDVFNGEEICTKYIPRTQARRGQVSEGNRTRKFKAPIAPTFAEHADTEQLAYNLGAFKAGDELEFTLKMHGTSQRTGHLKVLQGYKKTLIDKIFRRPGKPVYDWGYVSGTRRVVLDTFDGGFYGSNEFRKQHHDTFVGKLWKGETVYYEVVGFTHTGASIMGSGNNEKLGKDFVKQYGKETVFSYGCDPKGYTEQYGHDVEGAYAVRDEKPISDVYVYRMTMTNEDGEVVEYTPDFMRYRCEQMGVKTVLVFGKATLSEDRLHFTAPDGYDHDYLIGDGTLGDMVMKCAEDYYSGTDPVGKTHIREGVVVRIVNRPKFAAVKHKNFEFKVLEGIVSEKLASSTEDIAEDVLAEM
jgi:hypothetical protein